MPGQVFSLFNSQSATDQVYRCIDVSFHCKHAQEKADAASGAKAAASQAYDDINAHTTAVDKLRTQLDTATDPKTVADVNAQINAQNTWANLNQDRIAAVHSMAVAQHDIMDNQAAQQADNAAQQFLKAVP
jgi:hypothetical protein